MDKKGFTLIEALIVIGITAMLSSFAIVYTHIGQNQITLSIEESKIAQLILEARELSIATYSANNITCAYGVHFDFASSTYSLFSYNVAATSSAYPTRPVCPSIASTTAPGAAIPINNNDEYASGSWKVHVAPGVALDDNGFASDTIQEVLFYPPDPATFVILSGATTTFQVPASEAYVYLSTSDGSAFRTISVNSVGQVSL